MKRAYKKWILVLVVVGISGAAFFAQQEEAQSLPPAGCVGIIEGWIANVVPPKTAQGCAIWLEACQDTCDRICTSIERTACYVECNEAFAPGNCP